MRPSIVGQGFEELNLSDFELVRNMKGEWLCIIACAPAAFYDNPLQQWEAQVTASSIIVRSPSAKLQLQNILSSQYIQAMMTDRPQSLLVSLVDDDGSKQFSASVPVIWDK